MANQNEFRSVAVYTAKRPGAQTMPLPQSIHEIPVVLSERPLLNLYGRVSDHPNAIYTQYKADEMEVGSIGDHMMLFSKGNSQEGNKVFAILNNFEIRSDLRARYEQALTVARADSDFSLVKHLILESMIFSGILQTEIMSSAIGLKNNISRRSIGSGIVGGVCGVYNPGTKTIPPFAKCVIDVPNPEEPLQDIVMNKRFGFHSIRPFIREFDETNPYDYKHRIGTCLSGFNPLNGPIMKIQLGVSV